MQTTLYESWVNWIIINYHINVIITSEKWHMIILLLHSSEQKVLSIILAVVLVIVMLPWISKEIIH